MKPIAMLLSVAVLAASLGLSSLAAAQSASKSPAKPKAPASGVFPMDPDTLTLNPNGSSTRNEPGHRSTPPSIRSAEPDQQHVHGPPVTAEARSGLPIAPTLAPLFPKSVHSEGPLKRDDGPLQRPNER